MEKGSSLDILIYAHDGRGLGHVSRSVAIGMAMRRLYPDLAVCLLTGCRYTQELIGPARLDWMKLPSYETEVIGGRSRGIDGYAGITDRQLGRLRAEQIRHLVEHYRPRLVLADHSPQGKHQELVPALEQSGDRKGTVWLLGMRGVVGDVAQAHSSTAIQLFRQHYRGLLWYGDVNVLGAEPRDDLSRLFAAEARDCGYVSRLREVAHVDNHLASSSDPNRAKNLACTVAVPWLGEHTAAFLSLLVATTLDIGPRFGPFKFYVSQDIPDALTAPLKRTAFCTVEPFSFSYLSALLASKTAIVFGGYNSLVDIVAADIPALVILRDMQDREQQEHVARLAGVAAGKLTAIAEQRCRSEHILALLQSSQQDLSPFHSPVSLEGAAQAAHFLAAELRP